jgi:hypothetical protein
MSKIEELEAIMKLMHKYKINAVKCGEIEIAGVLLESEEDNKRGPEDSEEDDLFYST